MLRCYRNIKLNFNEMVQKKILFVIEPKRGAKTLPGSRENVWGVINSPSHN